MLTRHMEAVTSKVLMSEMHVRIIAGDVLRPDLADRRTASP